ncbi:MAG: permease [Clostridiales bacterium]|jgi:uncharacterized membrane protein YraQ (UPF0718 family)|nr:permease [Clostridiales bacterium]MCK9350567.1 permease [Clostridiales bacterium]MDD4187136.1 permease [Eubacteriales bacterium]NLG30722.1 permease [Clostridiaceae bacterium]
MKILKFLRKHLFQIAILLIYVILFFVRQEFALESAKNSVYYIREMLLIMPVVFVLTALLDVWVPKDKILRYLGHDAGIRGILLSFLIGSVSAGPIYAAFPMCVMLYKKGASLRNIIIILSAWAVIKIPMLLNEAKYLGLKFMATRWVLTVAAILIFSWIASRMVKREDMPDKLNQ